MVDYYLTAKIMNDTHASEVAELTKKHGVTSFKTQLHLKTGPAVWGVWVGGRQQGCFEQDLIKQGRKDTGAWDDGVAGGRAES